MMANIVKAVWVSASLFVLYVTLDAFTSTHAAGVIDVLAWLMLILSFPAGLAVSAAYYALGAVFSTTVETSYLSLAFGWLVYFVLGYLQWFMLLPWLWRKWKARRAGGPTSSV